MSSVDISLTEAQNKFLQLKETHTLFCAGMGSGKSYLMGLMAVLDAMHSEDALIGVYEPDYHLIRTVAVPNVEYWLNALGVKYQYNKNEKTIYTHSPGVGDIMFKSLDNPDNLVGYQTYRSHIDELDTLPEEKAAAAWAKIIGRNRQSPKGIPKEHLHYSEKNERWEAINKMRAYTTPEGFRFCYKKWEAQDLHNHAMVRGRTVENPAITEAYIENMTAGLTEEQARAYLEGKFVNLNSGTVYYAYDREMHDSQETVRFGESVYIGCDFNVGHQAATIYVKRRGGKEWHAVDEMHDMYDTPEMIDMIKERYQDKGHIVYIYPDSSGSSRRTTDASVSDISLLRQAGFRVRARSKNPPVKDRIAATNKAFEDRKLFVNQRACPTVASCFEQQAYAKSGEPDKTSGHDHQNDASTYPIAYELGIKKPAFNLDIRFMV